MVRGCLRAGGIDEIYVFIGQMSREEFLNDRKTAKAVLRNLEIVGEAGRKIPPPLRLLSVDYGLWTDFC